MTVAGNATNLTETGVDPTVREFTGTLPTVTVTDTRIYPDRISPDAFWYVLGSSSDFAGMRPSRPSPRITSSGPRRWSAVPTPVRSPRATRSTR